MKTPQSTVATWGKSIAVRIPSDIVRSTGLRVGQAVQFEKGAGGMLIMRPVRARLNLDDLLARVTPENMPDEADTTWGKPEGTEQW